MRDGEFTWLDTSVKQMRDGREANKRKKHKEKKRRNKKNQCKEGEGVTELNKQEMVYRRKRRCGDGMIIIMSLFISPSLTSVDGDGAVEKERHEVWFWTNGEILASHLAKNLKIPKQPRMCRVPRRVTLNDQSTWNGRKMPGDVGIVGSWMSVPIGAPWSIVPEFHF